MSRFHLAAALGASSLLALAPLATRAETVRLEVVPMQKQQELWSPLLKPQTLLQVEPRVDPWMRLPAALQQGPSLPRSLQVDPYPEGMQRL
ncbi:MAG: hypothetical protein EBU30_10100 [Synechococcaceae bacterium WB6_3B_236]|nr:hypothetical protein [Synechococcaceae bacterium WB6_3B_236]